MADISPEEARHDKDKDAAATHESSGYSVEGDTPPAQGLGVSATNHELDVDRPGDSAKGKIAIAVILGLVVLFAVLWFAGAVVGMF